MELVLQNIGILHEENRIRFDGITVLAGENGSGKSTISKSLYCMFRTFFNLEQRIYKDREREVFSLFMNALRIADSPRRIVSEVTIFINQLLNSLAENMDRTTVVESIKAASLPLIDGVTAEELATRIEQVMLLRDEKIQERIASRIFRDKFDGHIVNVNYQEEGCSIRLIVRDKEISLRITPEGTTEIKQQQQLIKDAIYIGDTYTTELFVGKYGGYGVERNQVKSLGGENDSEPSDDQTAAGELLSEKKASEILMMMEKAGIGDMQRDEKNRWVYTAKDLRTPIGIENVSSGTKAFLTLKNLFENKQIDRKSVIILDEPEVHLHPKWQMLYAEIIVLLQKTYDLTLLLSTHSADFVSFIEYYSKVHGSQEKCNYYLMRKKDQGGASSVDEVTDRIDEIYRELSLPFLRITEKLNEE